MKNFLTKDDLLFQLSNLSQITFEVTDACNLKCKYCGYGEFYFDYDRRENQNLPVEKAYAIIDYLSELWQSDHNCASLKHVYIGFYGGEPLLNVDVIQKVIAYITQKQIKTRKFTFSMTTNAMLLDKYMDLIVDNDFSLLISLDGDEANHSYRVDHARRNSFQTVYKHIKALQNKHPDYYNNRVNFNAVLHNRSTYENVYNYIKSEFGKSPNITELNDMGIRESKKAEFMSTYRNSQESLLQSEHYDEILREQFIRSGSIQSVAMFLHQYSPSVFRDYNDLMFGKRDDHRVPTGTCLPFSRKMFVTVNGRILPCERIGHQFSMGEIIDDLQVRLDLDAIAQKHNAYLNKISRQCKTCNIKKSCVQCIFNLEDLDGDPVCLGHASKSDYEQYIESQMLFLDQHPEDYYKIMEEVIIE